MTKQSINLKSGNYIQTSQPVNWEDETIRGEVVSSMSLLAAVHRSIYRHFAGTDLREDIEEMVQFFYDCRDFGVMGKLMPMSLYDSPGMERAIPFLLAATPLASLDTQFLQGEERNPLTTLAACVNSVFARTKLSVDHDEPGSAPAYFEWGVFENNIVGLDLGQTEYEGLTVYELSLLAGMSEQGVRNALQEKSAPEANRISRSGLVTVPAPAALEWLRTRAGFRSEDVMDQDGSQLVPIDKRGYFFNAKCEQRAGYKVGPKKDEHYYKNFDRALQELRKMEVPRFRRPNDSGRFGIVNGIRWVYKTREELGLS